MWFGWIWIFVLVVTILLSSNGCYNAKPHNVKIRTEQRKSSREFLARSRSSTPRRNTASLQIDPFNTSIASFEVQCKLGSGRFATVYKARKKDDIDKGCFYALKVQNSHRHGYTKSFEMLKLEFDRYAKLHSPFTQRSHYLFKDSENAYLAMELMIPFGNLFHAMEKIKPFFTETQARFYVAELLLAVEYIHAKTSAHGDLKMDNILLDQDGHLVVTDFGIPRDNVRVINKTHVVIDSMDLDQIQFLMDTDLWRVGLFLRRLLCKDLTQLRGISYLSTHPKKNMASSNLARKGPFQHYMAHYHNKMDTRMKIPKYFENANCKLSKDAKLLFSIFRQHQNENLQMDRIAAQNASIKPSHSTKEYMKMIKAHSFFNGINWNKLSEKQVAAIININEIERRISNHKKSANMYMSNSDPLGRKKFDERKARTKYSVIGYPSDFASLHRLVSHCNYDKQFFRDVRHICKPRDIDWKNRNGKEKGYATELENKEGNEKGSAVKLENSLHLIISIIFMCSFQCTFP